MTCAIGRIEDLVIKDRKVERKAETDGVGRGKLGLGYIRGVLNESSAKQTHLKVM